MRPQTVHDRARGLQEILGESVIAGQLLRDRTKYPNAAAVKNMIRL